jgi:hypothetical protein
VLKAGLGHSHRRVKAAALSLYGACISVDTAPFEASTAEFMPHVMEMSTVNQPATVALAGGVLDALGQRLPADVLAYALLAASEVCFARAGGVTQR